MRAIRRPEEPPWGCRLKEMSPGTSLAVQGLGLHVCTTGGTRSTSALGTKMLHAVGAVKKKLNEPVVLLLFSSVSFWGLGQHLPRPQFPNLPSILPQASDLLLQVNSLKARWWGTSRPPGGSPLSHWPAGAKRAGVSILGLGPACTPGAQMLGDCRLQGKPCSGWWWVEGRQAVPGLLVCGKQHICPWVSASSSLLSTCSFHLGVGVRQETQKGAGLGSGW